MRKISLFIFAVLVISFASAVEFNIAEEYPQGGAIITKISGSFQEIIEEENIRFYRGTVRVPMDFELNKMADEYYLYVSLVDKDPNNYSIVLEEVEYLQGANVIEEDLERNFTITEEVADFSISKGFIMTEDDFRITVQNLREVRINMSYEFLEKETIELFSGEIAELDFDISQAQRLELISVKFSSENTNYEIPAYLLGEPDEKEPIMFEFESDSLNVTMDLVSQTNRTVFLKNTGTEEIFLIKLSLSEELERYTQLSKEELLRLSFEFLLTKEPKEHILPRFNIMIIANYFPDYKDWLKSKI